MDEATRTIVATACSEVGGGETNGRSWTIYEIEATDQAGQPIRTKLRAFDRFPVGVPIEVSVERRDHPEHGTSFTLKPIGRMPDAFSALETRVKALESRMGGAAPTVTATSGGEWTNGAPAVPAATESLPF